MFVAKEKARTPAAVDTATAVAGAGSAPGSAAASVGFLYVPSDVEGSVSSPTSPLIPSPTDEVGGASTKKKASIKQKRQSGGMIAPPPATATGETDFLKPIVQRTKSTERKPGDAADDKPDKSLKKLKKSPSGRIDEAEDHSDDDMQSQLHDAITSATEYVEAAMSRRRSVSSNVGSPFLSSPALSTMTANSELEDGGGVHLSVSDILPKLDVNMDQLAKKSAAELITLVGQMNDVIQQQVSQLHAVLNERDRFEQIIERTNMSLMELKQNIDRTMQKNEEKVNDYKVKVKALTDRLAKEKEKNSTLQKKLKRLDGAPTTPVVAAATSLASPAKPKSTGTGGSKGRAAGAKLLQQYAAGEGADLDGMAVAQRATRTGISINAAAPRAKWSDKVRRDRTLVIRVTEATRLPDLKLAKTDDGVLVTISMDNREAARTPALQSQFQWSDQYTLDMHTLREYVDVTLFTRKGKTPKETMHGMCHIRRDALTADNERHEEWFPLREAKDAMAEIKVDADLQENDEDGSTQFLLKIVCARNLRRISTNAISIGGGSSTTSTFANLSLKSASSDNASTTSGSSSSTFVSAYAIVQVLPDNGFDSVRKSKVIFNNNDPYFDETFIFGISDDAIPSSFVLITLWSQEATLDHEFLGQVLLPVEDFVAACREIRHLSFIPLHQRIFGLAPAVSIGNMSNSSDSNDPTAGSSTPTPDRKDPKGSLRVKSSSLNLNVPAPAPQPLVLGATVSFGQLTRTQEKLLTLMSLAVVKGRQGSHTHQVTTPQKLLRNQVCDFCGIVIIAIDEQYIRRCTECGACFHPLCEQFSVGDCYPPLGQLRLIYRYVEEIILPYGAYGPLLELLTDDNILVLTSLGKVLGEQLEEVAQTLLNIFQSQGAAITFISQLMSHEIKLTRDPNTIFRNNSLASKSMDSFMKIVGKDYLLSVMKGPIDQIFDEKKNCEIDPTKIDLTGKMDKSAIEETQKKNMKPLVGYIQRILDAIFESVDRCPRPMRDLFAFLQEESLKFFPDSPQMRYTSVTAFIFLRFFCPSVLGPKLFGLRDENADVTVNRTLTLIAKIIQNLASGVELGQKEAFMAEVNKSITGSTYEMFRLFIDAISNNLGAARERVVELETKIEQQQKLLDQVANMHKILRNVDPYDKKSQAQVKQNLQESKDHLTQMSRDLERMKLICKGADDSLDMDEFGDYGRLFGVDVEKELAAVHRHLGTRKEAVLKAIEERNDEVSVVVAADLVTVLDQLEELKVRLLNEEGGRLGGFVF